MYIPRGSTYILYSFTQIRYGSGKKVSYHGTVEAMYNKYCIYTGDEERGGTRPDMFLAKRPKNG
jgi:hypothetical protein